MAKEDDPPSFWGVYGIWPIFRGMALLDSFQGVEFHVMIFRVQPMHSWNFCPGVYTLDARQMNWFSSQFLAFKHQQLNISPKMLKPSSVETKSINLKQFASRSLQSFFEKSWKSKFASTKRGTSMDIICLPIPPKGPDKYFFCQEKIILQPGV